MLLERLFLILLGSSFGLMTAGGVFTVLLAVGLIPRFAGKTHTGERVFLYENMVILGTIFGGAMSVFDIFFTPFELLGALGGATGAWMDGSIYRGLWYFFGMLLIGFYGLFAGIFIGSLAMAIAEMLDSIPIFARRIGFRHGLGIAVSAMALGKLAGSLYYFYNKVYTFGG